MTRATGCGVRGDEGAEGGRGRRPEQDETHEEEREIIVGDVANDTKDWVLALVRQDSQLVQPVLRECRSIY